MLPQYTRAADGGKFLMLRSWLNSEEKECFMVFLLDTGADILRRADAWLLDGTFRTCPSPFYQASEGFYQIVRFLATNSYYIVSLFSYY
jgi:hypothetical protein